MPSELGAVAVAAVTAIGAIIVAWISNRGGKKMASQQPTPAAAECGEHAHTRDLLKLSLRLAGRQITELQRSIDRLGSGIHRRFDVLEETRAAERKSQALGDAQRRLDERDNQEE